MTETLFRSFGLRYDGFLNSGARSSVCYAATGIQPEPANAMVTVAQRISRELITGVS